jgi:hypothetical protein
MRIAIVEARYPYKMSYLDEWISAWASNFQICDVYNVCKKRDRDRLEKKILSYDLVVALHTITADSNLWLKKLQPIVKNRKCPLILFVGNEYSNPWLSMEQRLSNIAELGPEIVATQLPSEAGKFLYGDLCARVVEIPHALPKRITPENREPERNIHLGFRGFLYPWYLLDDDRNSIVTEVSRFYEELNLRVDVSTTERLDKDHWYQFLQSCVSTVSSEGGSKYVFRTDDVWREALSYLMEVNGNKYLKNDFRGSGVLRMLPYDLKKQLRQVGDLFGVSHGGSGDESSEVLMEVANKVRPQDYEYVFGKGMTSRHLDAVACGTWQILTPGTYSGVLRPHEHYTPWDSADPTRSYKEALSNIESGRNLEIYNELETSNSHESRISTLLRELDSI